METTTNTNGENDLKMMDALLNEERPKNKNTFKITRGAYNKAMTYAKAIGKIAGTGIECYGYLIKPNDSMDDTITDIIFAENQSVQSAYVRVDPEGIYHTARDIEEMGYMPVGWWHSHGTFSPFHSGTDVNNFKVVLHSIASKTMFRKEKSSFVYDRDKKELLVNGSKIKNLELSENLSQVEVIKSVEQEPYAYSMVVNMYGNHYLEKITKTLISREEGHRLNQPTRPRLEIIDVEDDITYKISTIEDDITAKVYVGIPLEEPVVRTNYSLDKKRNERTITAFKNKALKSKSEFIKNYLTRIMQDSKTPLVSQAPEEMAYQIDTLEEKLQKTYGETPSEYNVAQSYDIQSLRKEMNLHFMEEYAQKESKGVIEKYTKMNDSVQEKFLLAIEAGKALANYSMERFTDYNNKSPHKYTNFISQIVDNLCTSKYTTFKESFNKSTRNRYEVGSSDLFLYYDRLKVVNNIMTSLTFGKDNEFKEFLDEFGQEYKENPMSSNLDKLIEEKLLSDSDKDLESFQNRTNYERKGVFPTFMGNVRRYFGGDIYD